jgi:CBS domain-containing protein
MAGSAPDDQDEEAAVQVRDGMSTVVLSIGPAHTLREAAHAMADRKVGAAVVIDSDTSGVGIITERDILNAIGKGLDTDREVTAAHLTSDLVFASPDWTLDEAATTMVRGGFRHLVVMDGDEVVGMLSVRDIVRCWITSGAEAATS